MRTVHLTQPEAIFNWHLCWRKICTYLIFIMLIFGSSAFAQNDHEKTFTNPTQFTKTHVENINDLRSLVSSADFISQIKTLTAQLDPIIIAEQNMFNKTAILSMQGNYQGLIQLIAADSHPLSFYHYTLHSEVLLQHQADEKISRSEFQQSLKALLTSRLAKMPDEELFKSALGWSVPNAEEYLLNIYKSYQDREFIKTDEAINIIVNTQLYRVLADVIPITTASFTLENNKRYVIEPEVMITSPEGIELSATIVRKRNDRQKRPAAFQFTIYADVDAHIMTATHAAAHGYVGIIANSRGKRSSTNEITPWEHEGKDATTVIDWISKQTWSDGQVVMYGGSYNGFTQWAAAKYMHPALKTIVPYAAASPITGLPYENNIVLTANYDWAFYVTNNKTLDPSVYNDWQKANQRRQTLYESGRPIVDIDKIDGKPNPWFQKWLSHPSYDAYYQDMLPYQQDYANINIPVLSITGYFDGGQISAVDFLTQHYQFNKNANHTLLIGPYSHFTAQNIPRSHEGNYKLDEIALEKDTEEITFAWFDHVLFNKAKPKLLKDKINYQLMGSNTWQHHPTYQNLNQQGMSFYLGSRADNNGQFTLTTSPETTSGSVTQTVDMTDRTEERNNNHWSVIEEKLNEPNGLVFVSEAFDSPQQFAGTLTGYFSIATNKRDVDIGYNLYEMMPDGKVFHLIHYMSRASYAADMSQRQLLTPGLKTKIPLTNSRMSAKLLNKGSRLVLVLNVNKNADTQVNLGSGKDVNTEVIGDAAEPLSITWFNDSEIHLPISPWKITTD
jgi:uncharacterized protein